MRLQHVAVSVSDKTNKAQVKAHICLQTGTHTVAHTPPHTLADTYVSISKVHLLWHIDTKAANKRDLHKMPNESNCKPKKKQTQNQNQNPTEPKAVRHAENHMEQGEAGEEGA